MRSSARVSAAAALAGLLAVGLTGCAATSSHPPAGPPVVAPARVDPPCARYHCTPGDTLPLTGGYAARLWSSPPPAAGDQSVPVVELLRDNRHQSWEIGRLGSGWSAELTCLTDVCLVSSSLGAHGGAVETLRLVDGAFTAPATASVEFDSGTPVVKDLDADGVLDVIGVENDYTPNFAQGHNYWATYRLVGTRLVRTGCSPLATHPATPTALLAGRCPVAPVG